MKASEIKGLSRDDLLKREKDAKEELLIYVSNKLQVN